MPTRRARCFIDLVPPGWLQFIGLNAITQQYLKGVPLMSNEVSNRRDFFRVSTVAGTSLLLAGGVPTWAAEPKADSKSASKAGSKGAPAADGKNTAQPKPEEDVSPAEDLMREHGVLKRVMLVYDEVLR